MMAAEFREHVYAQIAACEAFQGCFLAPPPSTSAPPGPSPSSSSSSSSPPPPSGSGSASASASPGPAPGSKKARPIRVSVTAEQYNEMRLQVEARYGDRAMIWDAHIVNDSIDLDPVSALVCDENVYDVFDLEGIHADAWSLEDEGALLRICRGMLAKLREYHCERVRIFSEHLGPCMERLQGDLGTRLHVITSPLDLNYLADIVVRFPLFGLDFPFVPQASSSQNLMATNASDDAPAVSSLLTHHCRLKHALIFIKIKGAQSTDIKLTISSDMPLTAMFRPQPWTSASPFLDYIASLQTTLYDRWKRRKDLVDVLVATYSCLEYDAADYSKARFLVKVKQDKQSLTRVIEFTFSIDFPDRAPLITIMEIFGPKSWKLDPTRYRYSPRWDAHRMGEELFTHACHSVLTVTQQQNQTQSI